MAKYQVHVNGNKPVMVTNPSGATVNPMAMALNNQGLAPMTGQQTNNQIMEQIATNQANQLLQNQKQDAQAAKEQDPLRELVNKMVESQLAQQIDIPKYTTIQDVLGAQKGNRLNTFLSFLDNPDTIRTIGNFLPSYGYNPKTGKTGNIMEQDAQRQEALMEQAQNRAQKQIETQGKLANDMYAYYQQKDIKEAEEKLKRDLAREEIALKREEMAERRKERALDRALTKRGQDLTYALGRSRLSGKATGGASGLTEKQMQKNIESLNSLNAIQGQMDRFANSFDKVRPTKAGAILANAYASKGFGNGAESNFNAQRTLLFNKIARELGGEKGVLSDQDIKRIETSLPSLGDSLPQKRAKMKAVYDLLDDRKAQYGGGTNSDNDPMGLGF